MSKRLTRTEEIALYIVVALFTFLAAIAFLFIYWAIVAPPEGGNRAAPTPGPDSTPGYILELIATTNDIEPGYVIIHGQVQNISDKELSGVIVIIQSFDADKNFIRSDRKFIDLNPLSPGQISPFKIRIRDTADIRHYHVSFQKIGGGEIPTKRMEKSE